jgi:exonuclease III
MLLWMLIIFTSPSASAFFFHFIKPDRPEFRKTLRKIPGSFPNLLSTIGAPVVHPLFEHFVVLIQSAFPGPEINALIPFPGRILPPLAGNSASSGEIPSQLTVLNGNLCFLPLVPVDQTERLEKLSVFLAQTPPDICLFQEVWVNNYLESLRKSLPGHWCVVPKLDLYNETGLVIFSRFRPDASRYSLYGPSWVLDYEEFLGNKGFLTMTLQTDSGPIEFLTTHLNAPGNDPANRRFTDRQFLSLKGAFAGIDHPVFCGGDLNTAPDHLQPLNQEFFSLEKNLEESSQPKEPGRRIDYFFWRESPNGPPHQIQSKMLSDFVVSDHHLMFATVSIPKRKPDLFPQEPDARRDNRSGQGIAGNEGK